MLTEQRAIHEAAQERLQLAAGRALDYELFGYLQHSGAVLRGLSVKIREEDVLLTLRLFVDGEAMVAFIGAETMSETFLKAVRMAKNDKLTLQADKYYSE